MSSILVEELLTFNKHVGGDKDLMASNGNVLVFRFHQLLVEVIKSSSHRLVVSTVSVVKKNSQKIKKKAKSNERKITGRQ